MANKPKNQSKTPGKINLSKTSQELLVRFANKLLTVHKKQQELVTKMEAIDRAYARYNNDSLSPEERAEAGQQVCDVLGKNEITPPIVVSQVGSMVSYWADVFLSGSPLFPVVSTPDNMQYAEQLEALIDDHATLGGYARQLLMFLYDCAKYNYGAYEADWKAIQQYSVLSDYLEESGQKVSRDTKYYTSILRLDPYNLVADPNVLPGDISAKGDYAGYICLESRIKLKKRMNEYSNAEEVYNADKVFISDEQSTAPWENYRTPPQVNDYISQRRPLDEVDWDAYFNDAPARKNGDPGKAGTYEVFTFYARIIPSDYAIIAPQPNTPQIWKVVIVNGKILVHAKRVISAYDVLPIFFGQPVEDGLGHQTESIGEGAIDFQDAAKTLYNIRFAAARRAVSDRALYDPTAIAPHLINSKAAAPKIPVNVQGISGKSLSDVYYPIPFDMRGTETALQDATVIAEWSKELVGLNNAQRGQFQKGNKSVQEWNDVMGNSDSRLRLSALSLEYQVFMPFKEFLKLNIFMYGDTATVVSQKSGNVLTINVAELRKQVLSFRIADGFTPKSKLASTEMITTGFQLINSSPILQQYYGNMLPAVFAHMMQLGGVRGLDQYMPKQQPAAPMQNLANASMQTPPQGRDQMQGDGMM